MEKRKQKKKNRKEKEKEKDGDIRSASNPQIFQEKNLMDKRTKRKYVL